MRELSEIALTELENNAKSEKESEENKVLESYYVMRGIKEYIGAYGRKEERIIKEKELGREPSKNEIAKFLYGSGADFVSVAQNYRLESELPFC